MIISVYGAGYVGLVSAVCLSSLGHRVLCVDVNEKRIAGLNEGHCPIYEQNLPELLKEELKAARLSFTLDASKAIREGQVHFMAVGTPSLADGSADLSQIFSVARLIAAETDKDTLLVIKSTVPVGTGENVSRMVAEEQEKRQNRFKIDVVSNPEFLREGMAVDDFLNADRIIIGGERMALELLETIYKPLEERGVSLMRMSRQSAELTKYASNAMLACRISFMNQISRIAECVGANVDDIRKGMGRDPRIGPDFLQAGMGYGGSCFPKDNRALIQTGKELGVDVALLEAVESINQRQKYWAMEQLNRHFNGDWRDRIIAVWGLAFKPGTNDLREASSLVMIDALLQAGSKLRLYDPVAMKAAQAIIPETDSITWCESAESALDANVDALVIATEWEEFKRYNLDQLAECLQGSPVLDGRNCYSLEAVADAGLSYYSVGRPDIS